jgi:SAM-dependent methyltransferase
MFLKELEDYPWFPARLRKMQLEFVGWTSVQLHLYRPVLEIIRRFSSQTWLDLGSGSGWPAWYIQQNASPQIHYTLSDLYPESVSDDVKKHIAVENSPLNLLEFQPEQGKQYSLFNAFHHFTHPKNESDKSRLYHCRSVGAFPAQFHPGHAGGFCIATPHSLGYSAFFSATHCDNLSHPNSTYHSGMGWMAFGFKKQKPETVSGIGERSFRQ